MITHLCIAVLAVAATFHFYWGLGGKLGLSVALPQTRDGKPIIEMPALGAHAVGGFLIVAMIIVLALDRQLDLPISSTGLRIGGLALALLFLGRALSWHEYVGFFKKTRTTRFAAFDTFLYSPLCLFLGIVFLILTSRET